MLSYYYGLVRQTWKEAIAYRVNFLLSFLVVLVPLLGQILLVQLVYHKGLQLGTWALRDLIVYFLFARVANELFAITSWWDIGQDIKNGGLNGHLLRPYSYFGHNFTVYYTLKLVSVGIAIAVSYLAFIVFTHGFGSLPAAQNLFQFLLLCAPAALLSFLLTFLLSIMAFYFLETTFVTNLLDLLLPFLTGAILPLDLFPTVGGTILRNLPTAYLVYYPSLVFTEGMPWSQFAQVFATMLGWLLLVALLTRAVWIRGLHRYEATG
jgi:ABC-2 type transport system permease protein